MTAARDDGTPIEAAGQAGTTLEWTLGGARNTAGCAVVVLSSADEGQTMAKCKTCGTELHPERAEKYDYCTAPECQEKNAKGLTIVALGQNKAADEYVILDARTRAEMASGRYHDQRRASFGAPASPDPVRDNARITPTPVPKRPARQTRVTPKPMRHPWSRSQEKLALLYNEQGIRPDEIARRLGLSTYTVTQIILHGRNRGRR